MGCGAARFNMDRRRELVMANELLRSGDGFQNQSPHLRGAVRRLQVALNQAGYAGDKDGLFGDGTERLVKAFQRDKGLEADGVVGPATWAALGDHVEPAESQIEGFRGDLSWVHAREGHAGKAYWPGGASGVTLDPGVDCGHARRELIEEAYKDLLSAEQFQAVEKVLGVKGDAAKDALARDPVLQSIRISRSQADGIFGYAATPYWNAIVGRFPALADADALPSVQTAMLSISYNRGAGNRGLEVLAQPIAAKDWARVADIIGSMQQDHRLAGIRKRRRMEADLIRAELG